MTLIEVCVDTPERAREVAALGADRIEYCARLDLDGLTPPVEELREVIASVSVPVVAMVRPRPNGFVMTPSELRTMEADIGELRAAGAAGVVLGALTPEGDVDRVALARLSAAAESTPVIFHRAFDRIVDPLRQLETLIQHGVERLLTAGDAPTAWEGRDLLRRLVQAAAGRITVMPGGGVRQDHLTALLRATSATEVHSSVLLS